MVLVKKINVAETLRNMKRGEIIKIPLSQVGWSNVRVAVHRENKNGLKFSARKENYNIIIERF